MGQSSSVPASSSDSRPEGQGAAAASLPQSVIHLDFFSGVGSATLALQRLGVSVRHVLSWEIDEAAIAVARRSSRKTTKTQRGSLLDDSPAAAARAVEQIPGGAADLLVITAAAPCPDFNRIRSDSGPGRHGPSGNLFVGPYAPDASDVSGVRDLESAQQLAGRHPLSMQRKAETSVHIDMQPAVDMWDHWHLSAEAVHPLHQRPTLEPAIELTLQRLLKFKPERLAEFRRQVLCDIKRRKQEMTNHTQEWFASLEPHVQQAYTLPDGGIVQIPLFLELLRGCAYPDVDALAEALSRGCPVLGTPRAITRLEASFG